MEKRVATGAEVFPKRDWNAVFTMSSAICNVVPAESHRICLLKSCWRRTALPQFIPVLEEVVSKEEAMTPSEIPQLSRASFAVADFTFPSSVLCFGDAEKLVRGGGGKGRFGYVWLILGKDFKISQKIVSQS